MKSTVKQAIVGLLNEHRIMTIATNRPDGWPQATVVCYANEALVLYCFVARNSQKFANIHNDPRVSIAIAKDTPQLLGIKGLSMAARALVIEDKSEVERAAALMLHRHPEYKVLPRPNPVEVPLIRLTPEVISVLDYSKGYGHTDLVTVSDRDLEDFIENRRHHWAGHPVA